MAAAIGSAETCTLGRPASRRFYVHIGSLGFLVAAQPTFFGEVAHALATSGASRALDQVVEDWAMFSPSEIEPALAKAAGMLHDLAAEALRTAFQCIVQLVPPRYGATELLLGQHEQINAWCYEDGYLTYATDEDAAAIMYAEAGSLRRLRSEIRRSPDFDPSLEMISGQSLFLFDQRGQTGPGTARFYKMHSARLLRGFRRTSLPTGFYDPQLARDLEECVSLSAQTFEGSSVIDCCLRRADQMVTTLLRSLPSTPAEADGAAVASQPVPARERSRDSTSLMLGMSASSVL
jgi:hypothetical protein